MLLFLMEQATTDREMEGVLFWFEEEENVAQRPVASFDAFYKSSFATPVPSQRSVQEEVEAFIQESSSLPVHTSAQTFWNSKKAVYSRLYQVALHVLSQAATATCAESMFSKAGIISSGRRSSIQPEKIEMVTWEHWNRLYGCIKGCPAPPTHP
jgi:hypothetical protein